MLVTVGVLVTSNDYYFVILLRICAYFCEAITMQQECLHLFLGARSTICLRQSFSAWHRSFQDDNDTNIPVHRQPDSTKHRYLITFGMTRLVNYGMQAL